MYDIPQDLLETARIIRQLVNGTFTEPLDRTRLNGHGTTVDILVEARQQGMPVLFNQLGPIFAAEPLLLQLVLQPHASTSASTIDLDSYWHDDLNSIPAPQYLPKRHGIALLDNAVTVLMGKAGTGKSFLALDWALHWAQTEDVLYLAAEKYQLYPRRVKAWNAQYGSSPQNHFHFYTYPVNFLDERLLVRWLDTIHRRNWKPRAVFVDTLARTMRGDENSSVAMGNYVAGCLRIQDDLRCAVILVHHMAKAENSRTPRGHGDLEGAVSSIFLLKKHSKGLLKLENTKQNHGPELMPVYFRLQEVRFGSDPGGGEALHEAVIVPVAGPESEAREVKLPVNDEKILALLATCEEALAYKDIVALTEIPKGTVTGVLKRLVERGYVSEPSSKCYQITTEGTRWLEMFRRSQARAQRPAASEPEETIPVR